MARLKPGHKGKVGEVVESYGGGRYLVRCPCGSERVGRSEAIHHYCKVFCEARPGVVRECRWCGKRALKARSTKKPPVCQACYDAIQANGEFSCGKPRYSREPMSDIPAEHRCPDCEPWPLRSGACKWCGITSAAGRWVMASRECCMACRQSGARNGEFPCGKPRARKPRSRLVPAEHVCASCEPWPERKCTYSPSPRTPPCEWCGRTVCTSCWHVGRRNGRFPCGKPKRKLTTPTRFLSEHMCDKCKPWPQKAIRDGRCVWCGRVARGDGGRRCDACLALSTREGSYPCGAPRRRLATSWAILHMCPDCQPPKRISRGQLIVALANAGPAALESKAWAARWRSKAGLPSAKLATDLHEWIHQFGTRPVLRVEWARKFPSKSVEASERGWERLKVRLREFGVPHELGFEWVSHRSGGDAHQVRTIKLTDPDWVRIVLAAVCPTDSKVWVIPKDVKSWR